MTQWLDAAAVAEDLGIGLGMLRRMARRGEYPELLHVSRGVYRVLRVDHEAWVSGRMTRRLDQRELATRNETVLSLARAGVSRAEIARQVGVTWTRVMQILERGGVIATKAPAQTSPTSARNADIVRRVAAGEKQKDIAQSLGITQSRVCQILKVRQPQEAS